jgi:asparagine synthase (glutamine-hydrolysing)
MCGITGVRAVVIDDEVVLRQLAHLRHRGPDSLGVHRGHGASVGQTRLAIIDLVTGDPPIAGEDGQVGVAFNGEIYNFRALQDELRAAGHDLKTDGDTEVIAHLSEDLEPEQVCERLDGMFAFAVWDDRSERLILARDRFGKKPLYYWQSPTGDVVFGSEIKAVLADPRVPRNLANDAIDAYLTFGYVPTPRTFFDGIVSLPPGHVAVFDRGCAGDVRPYWRPSVAGVDGVSSLEIPFLDAGREVRRLLCDAVDKRLVADVPLGAFLSGGIDSSAIVAFMARLRTRPVRTFTIGFEDQEGYDERRFAREVADAYGTDHTEFVVNPEKAELIERLVWHHDQPFGDSSALPTFVLSELTRRHVTVALSGDGGDELFGGYERFAAAGAISALRRAPSTTFRLAQVMARALPASALSGRGGSARRMLDRLGQPTPEALRSWISYVSDEWRDRLLPGASRWGVDDYARIWSETQGAAVMDRVLTQNLRTYLLDDLLPKVDRTSMAHGLEVRSPFLDRDLAEFAFRLPAAYKVRGWSLKRVLKEAVRDLVPHHLLHRRKKGFGIPLDRWFREDLRSFADGMLASPQTRVAEHLDRSAVRSMLAEHQSRSQNHGHALWTLLTLEVFLRQEGW